MDCSLIYLFFFLFFLFDILQLYTFTFLCQGVKEGILYLGANWMAFWTCVCVCVCVCVGGREGLEGRNEAKERGGGGVKIYFTTFLSILFTYIIIII